MKKKVQPKQMESSIKNMQKEIKTIKSDLVYIKNLLEEDFELSDSAKKQLSIARKTPLKDYVAFK